MVKSQKYLYQNQWYSQKELRSYFSLDTDQIKALPHATHEQLFMIRQPESHKSRAMKFNNVKLEVDIGQNRIDGNSPGRVGPHDQAPSQDGDVAKNGEA